MNFQKVDKIYTSYIKFGNAQGAFPYAYNKNGTTKLIENPRRLDFLKWAFGISFTICMSGILGFIVINKVSKGKFSLQNPEDSLLWYFFSVSMFTLTCQINNILHWREVMGFLNQSTLFCKEYLENCSSPEFQKTSKSRKELGTKFMFYFMRVTVIMRTIGSFKNCKLNVLALTGLICVDENKIKYKNVFLKLITNLVQYYFFVLLTSNAGLYFTAMFHMGYKLVIKDRLNQLLEPGTIYSTSNPMNLKLYKSITLLNRIGSNGFKFILSISLLIATTNITFALFTTIKHSGHSAEPSKLIPQIVTVLLLSSYLIMIKSGMAELEMLFKDALRKEKVVCALSLSPRFKGLEQLCYFKELRSFGDLKIRVGEFGFYQRHTLLTIVMIILSYTVNLLISF